MNKAIMFIMMLIISITGVMAAASVTQSYTIINKNSVHVNLAANETVKAIIHICTNSGCNAPEFKYTFAANSTAFSYTETALTENTIYYYKWNGTAQGTNVAYSSTIGTFTTPDHKINGAARTILDLMTLILLGAAFIFQIKLFKGDIKVLVYTIALSILGAIIVNNFIAAVLGL